VNIFSCRKVSILLDIRKIYVVFMMKPKLLLTSATVYSLTLCHGREESNP
jgi:hypothetical protein